MQLISATMLVLALTGGADTTLGAGVTLEQATPIAAIVKAPADYVGKTVRVDGVATAVCEMMGCWMAVAESDAKDAAVVRLKVEHEGDIVFPMSAKGKKVSAQGVFEVATAEMEGEHAAGDHATRAHAAGGHETREHAAGGHATHEPLSADNYQIKATGAIIR